MKIKASALAIVALLVFAFACTPKTGASPKAEVSTPAKTPSELAKFQKATFAGGCFWCEEAVFESIKGVEEVISGYSGGKTQNPTYEEVGGGGTGHAEAIEVYYDSTVVKFATLLKVYIASIDPWQVNGQGPDHGTQYRSIIFYRNAAEKAAAEKELSSLMQQAALEKRKCGVEILAFEKFWDAEGYHQNYVPAHPENPYVQHESIPRLRRTQAQVKDLVKPDRLQQ